MIDALHSSSPTEMPAPRELSEVLFRRKCVHVIIRLYKLVIQDLEMRSRSGPRHNNGMLSGWNQPSEEKRSGQGGRDEVEREGTHVKREGEEGAACFEGIHTTLCTVHWNKKGLCRQSTD
ncbi:hypothetical protein ILYODFUR_005489 [Ilyodon furcidens]|uniref:Uncharacterized protein n=1 Tax=Ilyodon furcidens TaxID=33524 RepID=A0ABV0SJ28_9TELE